jgi:hypothetical protein
MAFLRNSWHIITSSQQVHQPSLNNRRREYIINTKGRTYMHKKRGAQRNNSHNRIHWIYLLICASKQKVYHQITPNTLLHNTPQRSVDVRLLITHCFRFMRSWSGHTNALHKNNTLTLQFKGSINRRKIELSIIGCQRLCIENTANIEN